MPAPKELVRGSVVPVVLSLLGDRPMYGYEMIRLVQARTNGVLEWKEGTLYPTLHALEQDGLLKSEWRDVPTAAGDSGDRQRKYYALTRAGRAASKKHAAEWKTFADAINGLLSGFGRIVTVTRWPRA